LAGKTVVNGTSGRSTVYNAVESNSSGYSVAHSGNYGAFLGDTQLATLSQTVPTVPGYSYLLSIWLNNPTLGAGQHFHINWIATSGVTNTIYNLDSPPALSWTNLQFVVTASTTNAIVQVSAENDASGFGLDDISLKPLPALGFSGIQCSNGSCILSRLSGKGASYQVQYSTDIPNGPWMNLGSAITGTGSRMSLTDTNALGASSSRFYRLAVSP
jgi:hypothetical protein